MTKEEQLEERLIKMAKVCKLMMIAMNWFINKALMMGITVPDSVTLALNRASDAIRECDFVLADLIEEKTDEPSVRLP